MVENENVALDWNLPYQPEDATNAQLSDDWRLFIASVANLDAGKDEPFTYDDIYGLAYRCLKEILYRVKAGKMKFSISKEKSEPYEKLWKNVSKMFSRNELSVLLEPASELSAIYLVSPHAELTALRKKTMVVKARDFSQQCDKDLIFCSAGLCFGTLKMHLSRQCSRSELEELYPLHRISSEEIEKWWPEQQGFFCYDLYDVLVWDQPRRAEIPQGVQTFITNIKFTDSADLAPVNPSGVELGEEIVLDDVLKILKSFYRTRAFVSLIGGICNWGKTKGDIDFFIRSNYRDIATEFRIIRMFPKDWWHRLRFRYSFQERTHPGIFTNHVDVFDEKIERIEDPQLVLMSYKPEKGDAAPLTSEMGEDKGKCKGVELFKFCPLLKPMHGHYKGEEYDVDKLIEVVNNLKEDWYEKGIYVEKKFDGVHVRVDHSLDGKVIIFSEEGNEITDNLPTLRDELAEVCKGHDVVLTGELEFWQDKEHQSRQQTTAIIHTKEVHPDEKNVVLNVFDCLYYDSDIHNDPHSERLKTLLQIKDSEHFRKTDFKLVHSVSELKKAVEYFAALPGAEGAYLKRSDFPYELDGATRLNLKYKNTFSIDARVIEVHKVKDAEAWNYLCVIEDLEGADIPVGRSYNTSIKAQKGDIIKVEFVNLSQYIDPESGKVWFNWWAPHVIALREEKKKPDNILTAKKLVEASHGRVTLKSWPKRYEDAYLDSDPFLFYPDQSMKWKGMCHAHIRGRSVHLDFRLQISKDLLVGWTLYIPKGLSKTPESYLESVELFRKEIEPIVKETLSNPSEKFNCGPKAPEPIEWATYEGRVEPSAIGATKNEYGDFIIIDEFEVQFGAQKAYFHEYFCDGKIFNGRIVFRLLENRKEWKKTDEGLMTWMAFNALTSPSPYAISARAVKKKWIPPAGVSALPRSIRKKIPQRYQYWQVKDPSKRMEIRDELVAEVKKKLLKLDAIGNAQFKFIKQTWKGQKVIREGPSRTQFFFILKQAKKYWAIALNADIGATPTAAGLPFQHSSLLWTVEGEVSPKSILNPSKNTPSRIEVLDRGKAIVLSEGKFKKFMLKGKKLKGLWVAYQQEGSKMWTFERSALPEPVRGDGSIVLEGGVI